MMFDVKTLMFFMSISALLMAGIITLADVRPGKRPVSGLHLWTLALLVQAGAWLVLVASNTLIPNGLAGPLALACVSLYWGLRYLALCRCAGDDGPRRLLPTLLASSLGIAIGAPSAEWLVGLHDLLFGTMAGACAVRVRRLSAYGHVQTRWVMSGVLVLLGFVLWLRAGELLLARRLWGQVEIWHTLLEQLCFLCGYASTIIVTTGLVLLARAGHEEHLQQLAGTDALTGLLNRRSFLSRAGQALRPQTPAAVLMLDLDHFKLINDSFGHPAGDAVLRTVSATLASGLRREDLLARFGGEEFAVLLPQTNARTALSIGERLRTAVMAQHAGAEIGGRRCTISIGIAAGSGDLPIDVLITEADRALYTAKREGRNRCVLVEVPVLVDGEPPQVAEPGKISSQAARLP